MPPSSATLSACPEVRIVLRKALAWLSWSRRTLPMTAEVLGALNAAMPTPTTARQAATRHSGADSGREREQDHAGGDGHHAAGGEHARADPVAQAAAERAEHGHQQRHAQQQPAR